MSTITPKIASDLASLVYDIRTPTSRGIYRFSRDSESTRHFAEGQYDWQRTRKAWHFHATGDAGSKVFFTNAELRFPLIDAMATPIGVLGGVSTSV